jgi:aryl-phospho-beta-D-glucosidase BglC (GH1 family)
MTNATTVNTREQQIIALGKLWESGNNRRVYLDAAALAPFIGLKVQRYGSGNIASATRYGRKISNKVASELLNSLRRANAYWDLNADTLVHNGEISNRTAEEIIDNVNEAVA